MKHQVSAALLSALWVGALGCEPSSNGNGDVAPSETDNATVAPERPDESDAGTGDAGHTVRHDPGSPNPDASTSPVHVVDASGDEVTDCTLSSGEVVSESFVDERIRFAAAVVEPGESCVSELQQRVCGEGQFSEWSGTFEVEECSVREPRGCEDSLDGSTETRVRYEASLVPSSATCRPESQSRTCTDGTWSEWSGSFTAATCENQPPRACGDTAHGQSESRTRYFESTVPAGGSCRSETQTRLCTDGILGPWSGDASEESCVVELPPVVTVSTPTRLIPYTPEAPPVCGADNLGDITRVAKGGRVGSWEQPGDSALVCKEQWFGGFGWGLGLQTSDDWQDTPVENNWVAFVTIREGNRYVGSINIGLAEGAHRYLSASCRFGERGAELSAPSAQGPDAPYDPCQYSPIPDFSQYGRLEVRMIAGAPEATFYPPGQDTPLQLTFFRL